MKISYNWLKEYVDFNLTPQETAEILTSIGLEVGGFEEIESIKGGLKGLVVGQVLTCIPHPNSDHMHITTVDIGSADPLQIVCGAPNVAAGQKVIVATIGTRLYDGDDVFTIKKSKLRGVDSYGMICAEDEIGIGSNHSGIIVLPDSVRIGTLAKDYYQMNSDFVIEVDITPNRADAFSHYGVARDLYAYLVQNGYKTAKRLPTTEQFKVDDQELNIDVEVQNSAACPIYAGISLKGVKVGVSPDWLQNKLRLIGVRPINNVVDVTNYVLFAFGHPMHGFDADKIIGNKIVVKTLPEGTPFVTLDGVERKLNRNDLMICSSQAPLCMGGVFGGIESGVTEHTTNVFLECAYFDPTWIRRTARRHGLNTDSSFRYERGVDPNSTLFCLKYAAQLIKELTGCTISSDIKMVCGKEFPDFRVELHYETVNRMIGKELSSETVKSIVDSLEMKIVNETSDVLTLDIPQYRVDVQRECDVVEEILRIYGYNNVEIPLALKSSLNTQSTVDRSKKRENIIAEQLIGAGFNEILNNSLTKSAYYADLDGFKSENLVRIINPLSNDLNCLRQTLLFGGLECIERNTNRKNSSIRFYEFGNCYHFREVPSNQENPLSPYSEDYHLGLWISGKQIENSWLHSDEESSIYELSATVYNILSRLGYHSTELTQAKIINDIYSTAIEIYLSNGKSIASFGIVSKKILSKFEINNPVFYADIYWDRLQRSIQNKQVLFTDLPKYPSVRRDLALLVDKTVQFSDIEKIAFETDRKLLKEVSLFDVYEGKNIDKDKKSYAVSFILQDENQTLTDKAIDKFMQKLINNLELRLKAKLR